MTIFGHFWGFGSGGPFWGEDTIYGDYWYFSISEYVLFNTIKKIATIPVVGMLVCYVVVRYRRKPDALSRFLDLFIYGHYTSIPLGLTCPF